MTAMQEELVENIENGNNSAGDRSPVVLGATTTAPQIVVSSGKRSLPNGNGFYSLSPNIGSTNGDSTVGGGLNHNLHVFNSSVPTLSPRGRKFSHPVSLHSVKSTLEVPGVESAASLTKRRLSHVGEVVSRRLSTSMIGWRSIPVQTIVDQSKSLCSQYIRARLRKCGVLNKKLGLRRLRSVLNLTVGYDTCDVFAELNHLGRELESRYPKLYYSVCGQVCVTLTSEEVVHNVFTSVAQEVVGGNGDVTWGRVVAVFAVAGAMACDCVKQGHVNYVVGLVESMGLFVERDLAHWIIQQGGWATLTTKFKPRPNYSALTEMSAAVMVIFFISWFLHCLYSFISGYLT